MCFTTNDGVRFSSQQRDPVADCRADRACRLSRLSRWSYGWCSEKRSGAGGLPCPLRVVEQVICIRVSCESDFPAGFVEMIIAPFHEDVDDLFLALICECFFVRDIVS